MSLNLSGAALLVRIPAGLECERTGRTVFLCIRHSICTDWVKGEAEEVPTSLTLSSSVFSNHASGSGARTQNLFSLRLGPFHFSGAGGGD